MSKLLVVGGFVAGASIGALVTWKVLRSKYDELLKTEVTALMQDLKNLEYFEQKARPVPEQNSEKPGELYYIYDEDDVEYKEANTKEVTPEDDIDPETEWVNDGVGDEYDISIEKEDPILNPTPPYVISPEEFDEIMDDDYTLCQWTIFNGKDGMPVVADDLDNPVDTDTIFMTIGNCLTKLGEYEVDLTYVRNDRIRCAIEITEDHRKYSEVKLAMPYIEF